MRDTLVIIPTYNERETIVSAIGRVLALGNGCDVLVVDDGSPDGTATAVEGLQRERAGRVHLLRREAKEGLGPAYLAGFAWALERCYAHVCEMDGDLSHAPEDVARLRACCAAGEIDVAIGSRYVTGGGIGNWSLRRRLLSRGAAWYARALTGLPVKDPTSGFVCYRRRVLEALDLSAIRLQGYGFQVEMKFEAWRRGFSCREIPITFHERLRGTSKLSGAIVEEALLGIPALRFRPAPARVSR